MMVLMIVVLKYYLEELYLKDRPSRRLWVTFSRTKWSSHSTHFDCSPLADFCFFTNRPSVLWTRRISSDTISDLASLSLA